MPIKPIDLQTLFSQLGQVGKQQAAEKDGAALQQAVHGAVVKKIEDEAAKAVQRPKDDETTPEAVKDRRPSPEKQKGQERKGDEPEPEDEGVETVHDPALGGHVDISG